MSYRKLHFQSILRVSGMKYEACRPLFGEFKARRRGKNKLLIDERHVLKVFTERLGFSKAQELVEAIRNDMLTRKKRNKLVHASIPGKEQGKTLVEVFTSEAEEKRQDKSVDHGTLEVMVRNRPLNKRLLLCAAGRDVIRVLVKDNSVFCAGMVFRVSAHPDFPGCYRILGRIPRFPGDRSYRIGVK